MVESILVSLHKLFLIANQYSYYSHCSFEKEKCPQDLNEVPTFMPLSQFQLRPEKQIESMFTAIVCDDGFVYADDLLQMVNNMSQQIWLYSIAHYIISCPLSMTRRGCIMWVMYSINKDGTLSTIKFLYWILKWSMQEWSRLLNFLLQIFDILDPGCNGKLLLSKLLEDEVLKERYESLREFIEPTQPNTDMTDEQWYDDNMHYWERDEDIFSDEVDDDDIEVAIHLGGY